MHTKRLLRNLKLTVDYWDKGLSDSEISKEMQLKRNSVFVNRKNANIPSRIRTGRIGELIIKDKLKALGFEVVDMNEIDATAPFDLLVDGKIKVDVKTASKTNLGRYSFQLANPLSCKNTYERIGNKFLKNYEDSCDLMIFYCLDDDQHFFVLPSDIPKRVTSLNFNLNAKKYPVKVNEDLNLNDFEKRKVNLNMKNRRKFNLSENEIVYVNTQKIVNILHGLLLPRNIPYTYSVNESNQMDVRVLGEQTLKTTIDLKSTESFEMFQIELQKHFD